MDDIVHGGEEQLTPFEERCLFWVMYVIAMGEALWQSLWTVDSPSPFADSAERHLWLLPALLALAVAVATRPTYHSRTRRPRRRSAGATSARRA